MFVFSFFNWLEKNVYLLSCTCRLYFAFLKVVGCQIFLPFLAINSLCKIVVKIKFFLISYRFGIDLKLIIILDFKALIQIRIFN